MPLTIPLAYYFLLPCSDELSEIDASSYEEEVIPSSSTVPYTPLSSSQDDEHSHMFNDTTIEEFGSKRNVALSAADKWRLAKPLIAKYMLPLCKCLASREMIFFLIQSQSVSIS